MQNRICPACGFGRNWVDAQRCQKCGKRFRRSVDYEKVVIIIVLLAFFAGIGFGGYKVYQAGIFNKYAVKLADVSVRAFREGKQFYANWSSGNKNAAAVAVPEPEPVPVEQAAAPAPVPQPVAAQISTKTAAAPAPAPVVSQPFSSSGMALVSAGTFVIGSPADTGESDEHPAKEIYLDAYYIDKTEVTAEQYAKCVAAGVCEKPGCASSGPVPVTCVSWTAAGRYCAWKGKRLPTESEWEKAARAGSRGKFCFGDDYKQLGNYAWFDRNSDDKMFPVAKKQPNAYGIYDMHGNAWEWVSDWYSASYAGLAQKNPSGPSAGQYKSVRGGSSVEAEPACRSANRYRLPPSSIVKTQGFRCAAPAR